MDYRQWKSWRFPKCVSYPTSNPARQEYPVDSNCTNPNPRGSQRKASCDPNGLVHLLASASHASSTGSSMISTESSSLWDGLLDLRFPRIGTTSSSETNPGSRTRLRSGDLSHDRCLSTTLSRTSYPGTSLKLHSPLRHSLPIFRKQFPQLRQSLLHRILPNHNLTPELPDRRMCRRRTGHRIQSLSRCRRRQFRPQTRSFGIIRILEDGTTQLPPHGAFLSVARLTKISRNSFRCA